MLPQTRKLFFWALIFVFFLGGTAVIFYAQGWRLNLSQLQLRKVGAIYIHTSPSDAGLFLDGKPIPRNPGLFNNSTLINNLFPRRYRLEAKADGYRDWHATITVEPSLVSEIKNAVLVRAKPQSAISGKTLDDFRIINGEIAIHEITAGWQIAKNKISGEKIINWDKNSNILAMDSKNGMYFLNSGSGNDSRKVNIAVALTRMGITAEQSKIILSGDGSQTIFVVTPNSVWLIDPRDYSAKQIVITKPNEFFGETSGTNRTFAWESFNQKTKESQLWLYDYASKSIQINKIINDGKINNLFWINPELLGLVLENGDLFTYDVDQNKFDKKASDAKNAEVSKIGRLAVLENRSLEIFSDRDGKYWRFNIPQIESVKKLEWYGESHLFVYYPEEIRFLSLEDSSLENFVPVAETKIGYYEPVSNKLYFLQSGSLYYLDFIER